MKTLNKVINSDTVLIEINLKLVVNVSYKPKNISLKKWVT